MHATSNLEIGQIIKETIQINKNKPHLKPEMSWLQLDATIESSTVGASGQLDIFAESVEVANTELNIQIKLSLLSNQIIKHCAKFRIYGNNKKYVDYQQKNSVSVGKGRTRSYTIFFQQTAFKGV